MLRYLADENLPDAVALGLRHRDDKLDLVLAREVGLSGIDDPEVLEWAALQNRIVLTHDVATMKDDAYARVADAGYLCGFSQCLAELGHRRINSAGHVQSTR